LKQIDKGYMQNGQSPTNRTLQEGISQSIIGQEHIVERLLICLLANGNLLMEGLPGLGKIRAIKTLSNLLESDFRRIQFTPDLLPSDVNGSEVYYSERGKGSSAFSRALSSAT
jgi:MoxR-like ATPase